MQRLIASVTLILIATCALAQTIPDIDTAPGSGQGRETEIPSGYQMGDQAVLAMTIPDYLVTPGDTYALRFTRSFTPTTFSTIVEHDYTINLGFLGRIDASGLTFVELQDQVERLVTQSYPESAPQLTIRSVGRFEVSVEGDVSKSGFLAVDGLTRLEDVVAESARDSASLRNVAITSTDGRRRTYDYFAALRFGRSRENPYVRPGDVIRFDREDRRVSLIGHVHRPGVYQLLRGENLGDLLQTYGEGATDAADLSRVEIERLPNRNQVSPRLLKVDAGSIVGRRTTLQHLDRVRVPARSERQPVVYFEGAVNAYEIPDPEAERPAQIVRHPLREGETMSQAVRAIFDRILGAADLRGARLKRVGEAQSRPVDLESLLHEYSEDRDVRLEPGDRILIPFGEIEFYITGEVQRSRWVTLTTLARLEVVRSHFTPFSSERDILVVSRDGTERTYDLFRADRKGDRDENPYLRPGDRVVVRPYNRQVRVSGEVRKPGTYQLLPGENLAELLDNYADGLTVNGDPTDIQITRFQVGDDQVSQTQFVNAEQLEEFGLLDQDQVTVPNRNDFLPVAFFEGAVGGGKEELGEESTSDQIRYQFRPGESLSYAVRNLAHRFTPVSDLENAYLVRQNAPGVIAVDLREFLYSRVLENDILLEPLDRIVVPFRQFFVTVSGAVALPGQYPYIPDRTYEYYVGLAGGADPNKNLGGRPRLRDVNGARRALSAYVQPEDNIFMPTNNPLAYLSPVATVVGTAVSVISLVLALTGN